MRYEVLVNKKYCNLSVDVHDFTLVIPIYGTRKSYLRGVILIVQ